MGGVGKDKVYFSRLRRLLEVYFDVFEPIVSQFCSSVDPVRRRKGMAMEEIGVTLSYPAPHEAEIVAFEPRQANQRWAPMTIRSISITARQDIRVISIV